MATKAVKTIGVLTSGGDAPGMNACVRSVVRTAIHEGIKVKGIMRGYAGLLQEEIVDMDTTSVSDIISRGVPSSIRRDVRSLQRRRVRHVVPRSAVSMASMAWSSSVVTAPSVARVS